MEINHMSNKTKFKLNDAGITFMSSHIAIGGMYFVHNAKKRSEDESLGELMLEFSNYIAKMHFEDGHFVLSDDEYLLVLLAVNTARHAIINGTPKQLTEMTSVMETPENFGVALGEGKKAVRTAVLLVDYLELNAPLSVYEEWISDKKSLTNEMLNDLLEAFDRSLENEE